MHVITPDELPIVAITALLLLHMPPVTASERVTVDPTATDIGPVIVPTVGIGLTVITLVAIHPFAMV